MGVRRLRDPRKGTISLTKVLRRLSGDPSVVSRSFYFKPFPADYPPIPRATKAENEQLRKYLIGGGTIGWWRGDESANGGTVRN